MADTPYEELKAAIKAYGQAAFQNLMRCRALGEAVIVGFHDYMQCDARCVAGVPFEGPFDPRRDYGDEAFSFHGRDIVILEPVRFGISLIVGNVEDSGVLWLRTVVAADVAGDSFNVFVARRPVIRVPLDFEGKLAPVHEAIHQEFLDTFRIHVLEFQDESFETRVGFLPG